MTALLLAVAVIRRVPPVTAALVIGALHAPLITGTVVLGIVAVDALTDARRRGVDPVVGVIVDAAGELRSGRPLRAVVSSGAFGEQLAAVARRGLPIRAAELDSLEMFGEDARLVAATLDLAVDSGGPVAATFERLAAGMVDAERTRRERRAAMAPAMAQAMIVGGLPSIVLLQMVFSGRWMELVAGGAASATVAVGGALAVIGGVIWIVLLVSGKR